MIADLASVPGAVVLLPLLAAAGAASTVVLGRPTSAGWVGIGSSVTTLGLAGALPWAPHAGTLLLVDRLAAHMAILLAVLGLASSWGLRRASVRGWLVHAPALLQILIGTLLLAVLSGDRVLTWLAMMAATIAAALLTGLPGNPAALQAAWRLLVPASAGLMLALFGTVLLQSAVPPHGSVLDVAMVLVLLGYGALAGLVPLQSGSVEASAEGPAPVAALLAGGQPAVALLLLLRLRGFPEAVAPGPLLMGLGLLALLLAAIGLWRQSDPRRVAALATAGQIGVAAFAFGLDGPTATAAGLLHLTTLLLVLPAVMSCLAFAAPTQRAVGLTLATGLAAMASLPPFGLFASAFLIATETLRLAPWLALPLGLGLVAAGWALAERVVPLCLGPAAVHRPTGLADLAAAWMMLALGAAVPLFLAGWFAPLAAGLR